MRCTCLLLFLLLAAPAGAQPLGSGLLPEEGIRAAPGLQTGAAFWRIGGAPGGVGDTLAARPPIKGNRLAGQYLLGSTLGVAGAFGLGFAGFAVGGSSCQDNLLCGLSGFYLGAVTGFLLGTAVGVHTAGSNNVQKGSFLATLGGTAGGMMLVGFINHSERGDDYGNGYDSANSLGQRVKSLVLFSLPVWGAMLGHNLTRRYKKPAPSAAFVSLGDGELTAGLPLLSLQPDPLTLGETTALQISFISVRF